MMCINVLSKTSFLSLFSNNQPTNKKTEKAAKKQPKLLLTKKRFLEAQKNNRQTDRERERVAQKSTRREIEQRDDKTRRRKGEKTLFSLVLVFVFSIFFSSS